MSCCKPWVNLGNFLRLQPPTTRSAFTLLVSVYLFCGCAEICCLVATVWVPMIQTVTPCWTETLSITRLVSTGLLCGFLPAGYSLCISLCLLQTTLKSLPRSCPPPPHRYRYIFPCSKCSFSLPIHSAASEGSHTFDIPPVLVLRRWKITQTFWVSFIRLASPAFQDGILLPRRKLARRSYLSYCF